MNKAEFFIGGIRIEVKQGDITEEKVDAIVNAANNQLIMGGGVAGAIRKKGGESIQEEAKKKGPISIGESIVTSAGKLPSKYVIHSATMGMDFKTDEEKIRLSIKSSLTRADELKINSIAFPALGCGVGGFSPEKACSIMIEEICKHLTRPSSLKNIKFILFDEKTYEVFKEGIEKYLILLTKKTFKNPIPTVDIIIELEKGIVLIKRKNPPFGWALPGGFVEYGESLEEAVLREAKEETGLDIKNLQQFHTYSRPDRDPRLHTISTVFIGKGIGVPKASDDALEIGIFNKNNLPENLAFDHKKILSDYFKIKNN